MAHRGWLPRAACRPPRSLKVSLDARIDAIARNPGGIAVGTSEADVMVLTHNPRVNPSGPALLSATLNTRTPAPDLTLDNLHLVGGRCSSLRSCGL